MAGFANYCDKQIRDRLIECESSINNVISEYIEQHEIIWPDEFIIKAEANTRTRVDRRTADSFAQLGVALVARERLQRALFRREMEGSAAESSDG